MLPFFAKAMGLQGSSGGGWLAGSFERVRKEPDLRNADRNRLIDLGVCFPVPHKLGNCRVELENVIFYGLQENTSAPERYDAALEKRFREILEDFRPDIVHIFGTEFPHTLAMCRAFQNPARTLIGIQGLCGRIADVYMAELPYAVQKGQSFRDWYRNDTLVMQQKKFQKRAVNEREALQLAAHVTGRTTFDREATAEICSAMYHPMNETLRAGFYEGQWELEKAIPHSIFVSQGDYPLKGLHFILQAMPGILENYPDAHLYVAGTSIIGNYGDATAVHSRYPLALRISAYGSYLRKLIRDEGLEDHVTMLGRLTEEGMKQQYLKSHVFVCPSILENSPNAVCEAMILGMPVVAARVGGIPDFIEDGRNGLLFPGGHVEELTRCVKRIFEEPDQIRRMGLEARRQAQVTHNADTNFARLLEIYRSIVLN